jgi:hypothetical protein
MSYINDSSAENTDEFYLYFHVHEIKLWFKNVGETSTDRAAEILLEVTFKTKAHWCSLDPRFISVYFHFIQLNTH